MGSYLRPADERRDMFIPPLGLATGAAGRDALLDKALIFIPLDLGALGAAATDGVELGGEYFADSLNLVISIPPDFGAGVGATGAAGVEGDTPVSYTHVTAGPVVGAGT